MRRFTSVVLALTVAASALSFEAKPADAGWRHHHGGGLAFGIAAATIAGIALSGHHRYYYDDYPYYYDDYPYYTYRRHHYYRPYNYYYSGYGGYDGYYNYGYHHHHHHHHHW